MSTLRDKLKDIQERVNLYLGVNRYQSATQLLLDSMEELGELANLLNLFGVTYHKQSKFSQAIKAFKKALSLNPDFVEASLNLSIVYCDLGLYDQGNSEYHRLKSKYQDAARLPSLILGRLANLHCETARFYEKSGLCAEAIKEYEKALTIYPNMPDQILRLAELEYSMGQLAKCKSRVKELIEKYAPKAAAFNLLGTIAYREGDYISAQNYWMKSQEIDPDDRSSRTLMRCLREIDQNPA